LRISIVTVPLGNGAEGGRASRDAQFFKRRRRGEVTGRGRGDVRRGSCYRERA
jgi:hypothetical protein